jgi:hypothetical protein
MGSRCCSCCGDSARIVAQTAKESPVPPDPSTIHDAYCTYKTFVVHSLAEAVFNKLVDLAEIQQWTLEMLTEYNVQNQPVIDGIVPMSSWSSQNDEERISYWMQKREIPASIVLRRDDGQMIMLDGVHRMVCRLRQGKPFYVCVVDI